MGLLSRIRNRWKRRKETYIDYEVKKDVRAHPPVPQVSVPVVAKAEGKKKGGIPLEAIAKELKRDSRGRVHLKIVFYGPSLSGKTTMLRYIFTKLEESTKGQLTETSDPTGRTLFFDFVPITVTPHVVFDIFTVAGQKRHYRQRKTVLRDADGVIFVADSSPDAINENKESFEELKKYLGPELLHAIPIVFAINKRDLPNAMPVDEIVKYLGIEEYPIFETVAITGENLLKVFRTILKETITFRIKGPL